MELGVGHWENWGEIGLKWGQIKGIRFPGFWGIAREQIQTPKHVAGGKCLSFKAWPAAISLGFGRKNAGKACLELWLKPTEREKEQSESRHKLQFARMIWEQAGTQASGTTKEKLNISQRHGIPQAWEEYPPKALATHKPEFTLQGLPNKPFHHVWPSQRTDPQALHLWPSSNLKHHAVQEKGNYFSVSQ